MSPTSTLTSFWYRERPTWTQRLLLAPMWLASWVFAAVALLRRTAYREGVLKRVKVPARVISVGNLVAGGAGKTPVVMYLAQKLAARGTKVAVLSRGYGGTAGEGPCLVSRGGGPLVDSNVAGDEPVMISRRCKGVGVVVARQRAVAARFAVDELYSTVLLLDDGFQHMALQRDLDIVVVDSEKLFGNGHTLPYGPLREPVRSLRRADVLWLSRCDDASPLAANLAANLRQRGKLIIRSAYRVTDVVDLQSGGSMGAQSLRGSKVMMLAAVARPDSFRTQLVRAGANVVGESVFPDHHVFRPEELDRTEAEARRLHADVVVTTEKDAARLRASPPGWLAVELGVEVVEGESELEALLP